jgi:hypothetical protein
MTSNWPESVPGWIAESVSHHNAQRDKMAELERAHLRSLPPRQTTDYDQATAIATS